MSNQHESEIDTLSLSHHTTKSSQSLSSITENDSQITSNSLSDIQKEFNRISPIDLSSLTNSDQLSSIHYIDSSSSSEILNSLNRKISLSETDLLASIHRNINKQLLDNQSDDDILFLEWDKERNLFQDYINSLRKEIRVLLQERLEHQTQSKDTNDEQMKIDLLQKSLEEKNFVFEQLQTEYELTKDKNTNLIRKMSHLQTDAKSQTGIIDELKQKLTDLNVDLQNHLLVKRRLETSIINLENDCKILDTERLRLTNNIKENQHNKQDLEKLLQKANVQIAEQGSTIEMLRSENVQVRSQLSTIQRRMFQEKQQIMDYLRQIENDLIEKEQIKQRELLLRQDYEQLQLINKQDRKEIEQFQNSIQQSTAEVNQLRQDLQNLTTQCTQLNEANHAWQQYQQNQLTILHNRFKVDDNLSFDETIQQIENRFNNLQNECDTLNNRVIEPQDQTGDEDELRQNLTVLTAQCAQLNEANRAWQQFQQAQLENFRNKLQDHLSLDENVSFDQAAQLIIDKISKERKDFNERYQTLETENDQLRSESATNLESIKQSYINTVNELTQELSIMKDELEKRTLHSDPQSINLLKQSSAELPSPNEQESIRDNENNSVWQWQQAAIDILRNQLENYLAIDYTVSYDEIVPQIVDEIRKEREDFNKRYQTLEKANHDLRLESDQNMESIRQSYLNTVNELNQELLATKEQYEQQLLDPSVSDTNSIDDDQLKEDYILLQNQCTQLDNANQAWQQFYANQMDLLKNKFKDYLDFGDDSNFDHIIQMIATELEQKYQLKENPHSGLEAKPNNVDWSNDQILTLQEEIKSLEQQLETDQSSINSLKNNLQLISQENLQLKQQYDEIQQKNDLLVKDNHHLSNELQNVSQQQTRHSPVNGVDSTPMHSITSVQSLNPEQETNEISQLQTRLAFLSTQLEEGNHAWQQFHQNQLELFREKLQDWISLKPNSTLEQIAQQIANHLDQSDSAATTSSLQKQLEDYQNNESILAQNLEQLNQKLFDVYKQCEEFREHNAQLISSKQLVDKQLEEREKQIKELELSGKNSEEHIHPSKENINDGNVSQLSTDLAVLSARCAQLDEANRAWQQFQQAQLENFRNKLQGYLSLDENVSFDQAAHLIIDEIIKERNDFNERYQSLEKANHDLRLESDNNIELIRASSLDTIKELNQELFDMKEQHKELEQINKQLITENQNLNNQFADRSIVVGHHSLSESNLLQQQPPIESEESQSTIIPPTTPITFENQQTQTESFHQLFSISDNENPVNNDEDNDQLEDYINEISSLSSPDLSNQLTKECQQILSKQNLKQTSLSNLELNQLALITLYSLHNQHLTDEAKQLYHETGLRALQQEYELINNEKNDLIQQIDLERLHSKQTIENLTAKYQTNESQLQIDLVLLNEENKNFKENVYQQLEEEYKQLKSDFNELNNENELLKDYNAQMYQEKLQEKNDDDFIEVKSTHDADIQCDLLNELRASNTEESNWSNDWAEGTSADEQELTRLKTSIEELQLENEALKDLNSQLYNSINNQSIPKSHDIDIQCSFQPTSIDNSVQTEIEHEIIQTSSKQKISSEIEQAENNDWNDEFSPFNEPNLSSIAQENLIKQTIDNETQTDESAPVNNKHKRTLQTIKDRIQQIVIERPELFPRSTDDTIERLDHLITTIGNQAQQIDLLKTDQNQIKILIQERDHLRDKNEELITSSSQANPTTDNETQTDDPQQDKLLQINNKLKRALQTIKEKVQRIVSERPELFPDSNDDTIERIEHLISAIRNQTTQIESLQAERDHTQAEINELRTEQHTSEVSLSEDYQKQIDQLQQNLSQKDEERTLLREHLNNIELELRKTLDDHASTKSQFESITQERDTLVDQHNLQITENQHEIEHLQEELAQLKQILNTQNTDILSEEEIQSMKTTIEQQSQEIRDLTEKHLSQIESQDELIKQKRATEEQLEDVQNQIENLTQERAKLLEDIERNTPLPIQTTDNESQTDDRQHEKMVQVNNKLKRVLQGFKDKIHRVVTERPDLFDGIGEETGERLDHLISTVENQATQIDELQTQHDQTEKQLQNEIKELQSSLDAHQYQIEDERPTEMEQLASASSPTLASEDINSSVIQDYQKEIDQLQQSLSQKEGQQTLSQEHLNQVELELRKAVDSHALAMNQYESLIQERDALVEQQVLQSAESQREIELLKAEIKQPSDYQHVQVQTDEDIIALEERIEQQSQQLNDLNEKNATLSSQLESQADQLNREKEAIEERLNEHKNRIDNLMQERAELLKVAEENTSSPIQTADNESQTDDRQHEKMVQVNNKLKRALQGFKDKIHRIVSEKPDLFDGIGEETSERLDHLISTLENQGGQIYVLQAERDQIEKQLQSEIRELHNLLESCQNELDNERRMKTEQLVSSSLPPFEDISPSISEDYQKKIDQLQQDLAEKEVERALFYERLNEVELKLRKTVDDHTSTMTKYESLVEEHNALVEQETLYSAESQREIEELKAEVAELKQSPDYQHVQVQTDEDIKLLHETIEEQSEQLKDLNERNATLSSQVESQAELNREKKEMEERLQEHENQIENLMQERAQLLKEAEENTPSPIQTTDNESQTDDRQHEKTVQVNNKLKRVLQGFKDKIHHIVSEKPDLFDGIGEETSERLDHLISTLENQATQIDVLQTQRDQVEEQLQNEMRQLQSSLESCQNELDSERQIKTEQVVCTVPLSSDDNSSSIMENYQNQIEQLQQNLFVQEDERTSLVERLHLAELELKTTVESYQEKLQSVTQERNVLTEQQALQSTEHQQEIEQLKKDNDQIRDELAELKQAPDCQHVEIQTDEDINALHEMIKHQTEELKALEDKCLTLSTQIDSNTTLQAEVDKQRNETEEQIKDYQNQIGSLTQERANLLEEVEKNTTLPIQTTDNEIQTDDRQHEKMVQVNNKLKRVLQGFKDKIHRVVTEKPDLFDGIGEEISERLDHLISTLENQATQIDELQTQNDQTEKQRQNEIKELQSSLDAYQYQIENERPTEMEQLASASSPTLASEDINSSLIQDYQKEIDQLQQNLSQKDAQQTSLQEHLNQVELELKKVVDSHALAMNQYESLIQERDALVEQQVLQSAESQREIELLKAEIKQPSDYQHVQVQTDEDIITLEERIDQQSQQLNDLNEKNATLSSQLESQADQLNREKEAIEERLNEHKNRIENLMEERAELLKVAEENTSSPIQTADNESQTDDRQHEKMVQVNNKLKRVLQSFKDKIHRIVTERPDLFDGIGEETSERLDHLILTVENQTTQISELHAQRDQVDQQLQSEIKELQSSLDAYQYQIDNERPIKIERLVSSSASAFPSKHTSSSVIEDYQKQINQLQENLADKDVERTLLREHLNEVELKLKKVVDYHRSVMTNYESLIQERDAFVEQQTFHSTDSQHAQVQTDEDIKALHEMIGKQSEQLKDLNEKNVTLSSKLQSQADQLNGEKKEMEQRLNEHKNQIENLIQERAKLLEDIEKNTPSPIQTTDNEVQTDDDEHEKLLNLNNTLKQALETIGDKIHQVMTARSDLFGDIGEDTIARLDHLISTIESQTTQINVLQSEHDQAGEKYRHEISNLQNSFDNYQQQLDNEYRIKLDEHISSLSRITHEIDTQTIDFSTTENQISQITDSDDNEPNTWFDASPDTTNKEETEHQQFEDVDNQYELDDIVSLPSDQFSLKESLLFNDNSTQTEIDSSSFEEIQQIIHENLTLLSSSNENPFENLSQIISIIKNLQNKINELQSSFDTYRDNIENERLINMEQLKSNQPNNVCTQTLGLSILEEHRKQIEKLQENESTYQREIERLIEERDQARDVLSHWKDEEAKKINDYQWQIRERDEQLQQHDKNLSRSLNNIEPKTTLDVESRNGSRVDDYQSQIDDLLRERMSLMKQIASQSSKADVEIQTINDTDLIPSSDQGISRHIFEQEMLAWSKESEQLKRFVKQFQIENKKLKDIILKFERMILDYIHENERLKHENQHLSLINYSSIQKDNFTSSDKDICHLTLKWLTYEVAQRTANNHEQQSLILINDSDNDNQRQIEKIKTICVQNERLKNQLETYTIQFKRVQHDMNVKIQEMSALKDDTERLHTREMQYRLEIDHLKSELQDDKNKIQQLERELLEIKLKQLSNNETSVDNLRELLELKERELNALKEKLDYTKQTHQLELQEAIKANQFSLENVKRYEQMDLRQQEKRRELETRLGKFCTITRPLIDNQQLFIENPIINIDELRRLIAETDNEERVVISLSPIRDCLSLLEAQMKDLHHNIIENHARRSKRWKYTLGFECLSCESRWEVTHDIRDLQEACLDPTRFLESSMVEPMAGCSCPIIIDFIESDVRLCLDDMINEVILRTTMK